MSVGEVKAMPDDVLPRIAAVSVGAAPLTLDVRWRHGDQTLVDVSSIVNAFRLYARLRHDAVLFATVRVGEYGTDVVWTEAIDMAADTLWRLARQQVGQPLTSVGSRV